MPRAIILANCGEKEHKHDSQTVLELSKLSVVKSAIETFVRVKRKPYCIMAQVDGKEDSIKDAIKVIERLPNLKSLKRLTAVEEEETPFSSKDVA